MRILYTHIAVIIISLILFSNCSKKDEIGELTRHGGTVAIALNTTIEDLFPLTTDEFNVDQIHKFMLTPSFVSFDENENAIPNIADIWKIDTDNLSITFILNPDFKWSNGKQVTISDVKYSFELLKNFENLQKFESIIKNIKELKIIDSLSCQITFNQAVAEPLYFTNIPIFPAKNKYDISDINKFKQSYFKEFIGCGPFILSGFSADSLRLVKNNYYPNNFPYLNTVVFKFITDSDKIKESINSSKTDFVVNLPLEQLANKSIQQKFNILSYQEKGYTFIGWNLKSGLLKDKNMRLSLSHSIDRQTLIDGIMGGYSEIVNGPVYYNQKGENEYLPNVGFSATKAESLFTILGWSEINEQGVRVKNARVLSLRMLVNKENIERVEIANNIKSNLKSLGVELKLQFVSWKELLRAIDEKVSDAILLTWTDSDYYDPSLLYHSKAINDGLNFMSYNNEDTDSLIDQALFSWEKKQKDYYWKEFQKQVANDLPCTFLFSQKIIVVSNKKIQNVQMDSRGFLTNIKEWWIE